MMQSIRLDSGRSLLDVFSANVCGRDLRQGKPNPEIFLLAAAELGSNPHSASSSRTPRRHRGGPRGPHGGARRRPSWATRPHCGRQERISW